MSFNLPYSKSKDSSHFRMVLSTPRQTGNIAPKRIVAFTRKKFLRKESHLQVNSSTLILVLDVLFCWERMMQVTVSINPPPVKFRRITIPMKFESQLQKKSNGLQKKHQRRLQKTCHVHKQQYNKSHLYNCFDQIETLNHRSTTQEAIKICYIITLKV